MATVVFTTLYSEWRYDSVRNRIQRTRSNHVADKPFLLGAWVQLQVVPEIVKGQKVGLVVDKDDRFSGYRQTGNVTKIRVEGEVDKWVPSGEWIAVHS